MAAIDKAELLRRFKYHAPNVATRVIHEDLRAEAMAFARALNTNLPGESREKSLAFTAFEEAMFWAHAHVARNVGREE